MSNETIGQIKAMLGTPAELLSQYYGLMPNRGMVCCPYHYDKNPSMKVDLQRAHCFGCGWSGDSLDIYAKANDLSLKEAIRKLRRQVGGVDDGWRKQAEEARRNRNIEEKVKSDADACFRFLCFKRWIILRLLKFSRPLMDTDDGQSELKAMIDQLNATDDVLPVFYSGKPAQLLYGLRAARRAGLWE